MNLEINYDLYGIALTKIDDLKKAFSKCNTKAKKYHKLQNKLCGIAREAKIKVTESELVDTTVYICRKW